VPGYPKPAPERLPWWAKLLARFMFVPWGWAGPEEGFNGYVRIYLFRCGKCGRYSLDYLRGYSGYLLCRYCLEEERKREKAAAAAPLPTA